MRNSWFAGAAMNVPSAVAMIRLTWPDPVERGRAYSIYGAFGATGTCVGFIVGGVLASLASWRWGEYSYQYPLDSQFVNVYKSVLPSRHRHHPIRPRLLVRPPKPYRRRIRREEDT